MNKYLVSIEENLERILRTIKGERVLNFIVGGEVFNFIDKRLTVEEVSLLKYHIYENMRIYEPRIDIITIGIKFGDYSLEITITYSYNGIVNSHSTFIELED